MVKRLKKSLSNNQHLVVRYEDYRFDPVAALRRAVDFLGVVANDEALRRATAASSFERLHRLESEALARGDIAQRFNRAGVAHEHRRAFDTSMHAEFDTRYDVIFDWLGYDANPVGFTSAKQKIDIEPLLAAMRIEQAQPSFQPWLRDTTLRVVGEMASDITR